MGKLFKKKEKKTKRGRPKIPINSFKKSMFIKVYISPAFYDIIVEYLGKKCLSRKLEEIIGYYIGFLREQETVKKRLFDELHQQQQQIYGDVKRNPLDYPASVTLECDEDEWEDD